MKRGVKGQVAIFIIIAVMLVAAGGLTYYVSNKNSSDSFSNVEKGSELSNVRDAIVECRESSATDALISIGISGGYFDRPLKYYDLGWTFIPYYYDEGEINSPDKTKIEIELGKATDKELANCIESLKFNQFEINHGNSKTKVTISRKNILFNMDMKISVKSSNNSAVFEMNQIPLNYNSSLFEILEIAKYVTDAHVENADMICVTCIAEMAEERDLYVYSFDAKDNSILMLVMDNSTSVEPYYFEWLNKYSALNLNKSLTLPPAPASS